MVKKCLNGWWDFYPIYNDDFSMPQEGWLKNAYLVPSVWRKSLECVKKENEEFFRDATEEDIKNIEVLDFLYDDYNYPKEWTRTKNAWVKTDFFINTVDEDTQYLILLEAVMPYSKIYINGVHVSEFVHPTLPNEIDISDFIKKGNNELAVLITDYDKDEYGRYMTPTGTMLIAENCGIWQDVYLCRRNKLHIEDCSIRTCCENGKIEVITDIANNGKFNGSIDLYAYIYDKDNKEKLFCIGKETFYIEPSKRQVIKFSGFYKEARLWEPSDPNLYTVVIEIVVDNNLINTYSERFGFRQIEIKGKDILLNNKPIHLFSDWGHKVTTYCYTKEWISAWFDMIKDCNMNHSRLHTCPHPKIVLDMADEQGVLITAETGLHGSGGYQASNSEQYWENAKDHVIRFIKRDKNHPSLILWSVENEMRWNQKGEEIQYPEKILKHLPEIKNLINELDPTRPAYHEGDSSLWDESSQDIVSRHYGKDGVGADWWDEKKPLHFGEMALYHYEGPNTAVNICGDKAYTDFKEVDIASGLDAKMLIEYGRTKGISCFGPWNQSCLKLIRYPDKDISLKYKDYNKPGVKPLFVRAYTSEFAFWKKEKNYRTQKSFNIQKNAFRPFALIDYSLKDSYFDRQTIERNVYLVNDFKDDVCGSLTVFFDNTEILRKEITIKSGYVEKQNILINNNIESSKEYISEHILKYSFKSNELVLDEQSFKVNIYNIKSKHIHNFTENINTKKVSIYNGEVYKDFLTSVNVSFKSFDNIKDINSNNTDILIIGNNCIQDGSTLHENIRKLLEQGVNVLLMEQKLSVFKDINLVNKQYLTAFRTNSKIIKCIKNEHLRFWGEDPYAKVNSNSFISSYNYQKKYTKDDIVYVLEAGEGSFGRGDLSFSPLMLLKYGRTKLFANQLNISNKLYEIPQAQYIFLSMLSDLTMYNRVKKELFILNSSEIEKFNEIKDKINKGATLLINILNKKNIDLWNKTLNLNIKLKEMKHIYQGAIKSYDQILSGISNDDLNGVNTYSYSRIGTSNYVISEILIEKNEKVKSIIETCENSMMKELFVFNGHAELRRAYTISKYSYSDKKRNDYTLLGSINYGKGKIYFNQIEFDTSVEKYKRLQKRFEQNLSYGIEVDSFNYKEIKNIKSSNGYPERVYVSLTDINDFNWPAYVKNTKNNNERMVHKKVYSIGRWDKYENHVMDCALLNSIQDSKQILIAYNIYLSEPRMNSGSNLGIPNPEDLTFLHFNGNGNVRLAINGFDYGSKNFINNSCFYSDISLEKGINYILISWTPKNNEDKLTMQWKNINMKSENTFEFLI